MLKLLEAYRAKPTLANAQKVRAHSRAHPFSTCLLQAADADLMADAIHHANKGATVGELGNENIGSTTRDQRAPLLPKPFSE